MSDDDGSISRWLEGLKAGEAVAVDGYGTATFIGWSGWPAPGS